MRSTARTRASREERRRRNEEAVQRSVDSIMRDSRYDVVRGRGTRRTLVVALVAVLTALIPTYLAAGSVAGTALALVGVVVLVLLRQATRILADAPPELLDERQRAVQGETYLAAYRVVAGLLTLSALAAFFAVLSTVPAGVPLVVDADVVAAVALTLIGGLLAAPTCVYAWSAEVT